MSKQCEKHPDCGSTIAFSDGRFKFCTDCIAEAVIKNFNIPDLATAQEKEQAHKFSVYGHVDARITLTPQIATFVMSALLNDAEKAATPTEIQRLAAEGAKVIAKIMSNAIEQNTGKKWTDILSEIK